MLVSCMVKPVLMSVCTLCDTVQSPSLFVSVIRCEDLKEPMSYQLGLCDISIILCIATIFLISRYNFFACYRDNCHRNIMC